ncbi:MAG: GNAT family N-acetyltransferase [Planctomycetes bacterium]|nr:GNAT family N-acetyltransferase [Planctomycetota bacterium]
MSVVNPNPNPLHGDRLLLRGFEREDAELYRAWVNEPEIMDLVDRALPVTRLEHDRWYEALVTGRSNVVFALEALDRPRFVGVVWLADLEPRHRRAELRIVIGDRACWGKGYGREAIALLLRHAFEALNLHKVYAYVLATNPRAAKAFLAAGFAEEAVLKEDRFVRGRYVDVLRLAALRPTRVP